MPKISELGTTEFPSLEHFFPAARDNETVRISLQQLRDLLQYAASEISSGSLTVEQVLASLSNDKADRTYVDLQDNALGAQITDLSQNIAPLTAFARTILDDTSGGEMMATIGSVFNNATNGRLIIPVGSVNFWLQWMQLGGASVDFIQPWGQAFPNNCLLAGAVTESVPVDQTVAHYVWVTEKSPATVTVRRRTITSGVVSGGIIEASVWGIGW